MLTLVTRRHIAKIIDQILLIGSVLLLALLIWNFLNNHQLEIIYDELYTLLWVTFLTEFFIKISLAKHKIDYILSNILVVFIILFPFLRVLNLFPISRWSIVILIEQVNARLPVFRKYHVLEIFLISSVLIILSADIFLRIETTPDSLFHSFGDAIWFAIVTVATVGYGDIYPKTFYGRILASFLIIFGISIFGIITASISSYLVEQDLRKSNDKENEKLNRIEDEEHTIEARIDALINQEKHMAKELQAIQAEIHHKRK